MEIADSSAHCFPLRHNLFKFTSITFLMSDLTSDCTVKLRNVKFKQGIFSLYPKAIKIHA